MSLVPSIAGPVPAAPVEDPVPGAVHAVIELYANQLANVTFPEIDAASLRQQADELRAEAKAVVRARELLEASQQAFASRKAVLAETAGRAIAYARIYSDAHPDRAALASALAQVQASTAEAAPPLASMLVVGKRRGRPPKRSAELFDATATAPVHQEPAP